MKDEAKPQPIAEEHAQGKHCPGWVDLPRGTAVARVIGRALDKDGKLSARTVNQEDLALDRFEISPVLQEKLAKALADGGAGRITLPDDLARLCMAHTFLGNKDAGPLSKVSVGPVASDVKQCELERFQYGSDGLRRALANKDKDEVELLTAGRYIDMDCGVRFGIIGEPVADDKVKDRK